MIVGHAEPHLRGSDGRACVERVLGARHLSQGAWPTIIGDPHVSTRAPLQPLRNRRLMRPYALVYFYRRRLRIHGAQELLAVVGVAVSVALVFAVTLANASVAGSAERVARAVIGPATLQIRGRAGEGFSERLLNTRRSSPWRQAGRAAARADDDHHHPCGSHRDRGPRRHRREPCHAERPGAHAATGGALPGGDWPQPRNRHRARSSRARGRSARPCSLRMRGLTSYVRVSAVLGTGSVRRALRRAGGGDAARTAAGAGACAGRDLAACWCRRSPGMNARCALSCRRSAAQRPERRARHPGRRAAAQARSCRATRRALCSPRSAS